MTKMFVLIATAGRAESLEATLKSLAACERPAGFQRVVVVENGPRANKSSARNAVDNNGQCEP